MVIAEVIGGALGAEAVLSRIAKRVWGAQAGAGTNVMDVLHLGNRRGMFGGHLR